MVKLLTQSYQAHRFSLDDHSRQLSFDRSSTGRMTLLKCCTSLVPSAGSFSSLASTVVEKFGYAMVLSSLYRVACASLYPCNVVGFFCHLMSVADVGEVCCFDGEGFFIGVAPATKSVLNMSENSCWLKKSAFCRLSISSVRWASCLWAWSLTASPLGHGMIS
jgi:hypothetical protein